MIKLIVFFSLITSFALIMGCEDPVPTDYVPEYFVEGYLKVGEPVNNVILMLAQPIQGSFVYDSALIPNADVRLISDDGSFQLDFKYGDQPGYYYADENYLVKPDMKYRLEVRIDGSYLYAETKTPAGMINWITDAPERIQYPKDTLDLPKSSEVLSWTDLEGTGYYPLSVKCLDTAEYGIYFDDVPDNEMNRRVYRPWLDDDDYNERTTYTLVPNTEVNVVWSVFRWYGLHEVNVMAADDNFVRWFLQNVASNSYNELLSSVKGDGIGGFGSVAMVKDTFLLVKNQP